MKEEPVTKDNIAAKLREADKNKVVTHLPDKQLPGYTSYSVSLKEHYLADCDLPCVKVKLLLGLRRVRLHLESDQYRLQQQQVLHYPGSSKRSRILPVSVPRRALFITSRLS